MIKILYIVRRKGNDDYPKTAFVNQEEKWLCKKKTIFERSHRNVYPLAIIDDDSRTPTPKQYRYVIMSILYVFIAFIQTDQLHEKVKKKNECIA